MTVTDPYGRAYAYDGEEITIETPLTREQHEGCYDAVGIPAPRYEPDKKHTSIEPAMPGDAERLRRWLADHGIAHRSELTLTFDPDSEAARELAQLIEHLERVPVFPGELEDHARAAITAASAPRSATPCVAVATLLRSFPAEVVHAHIEAAQARETDAQRLIALASERGLRDDALDEAVHDCGVGDASQINNEGRDAQIRHLLAHNSAGVTRRLIEQAAP
jgi:hypothetical protein